ncbi:hypothetical protein VTN77DRAFT_4972 [Rasamsonia byssochlamydoides]|uniref:uncharacterized protein n=1 Tax=Rasamsonia byssochlamydoides TaxID=89139 RepID=UPI0037431C4E
MSTSANLSLVHGPTHPPLWTKTLGQVIAEQARQYGDKEAVVVPWQATRLTYRQLAERSKLVAKALLDVGLRHGQCVGIMAGNCYEYIEVFLGGARIGCPVVVLNTTYSPEEFKSAVSRSSCRVIFVSPTIGSRSLAAHIDTLSSIPELQRVVILGEGETPGLAKETQTYSTFTNGGHSVFLNDAFLRRAEKQVQPSDVLNLQFTSGTTSLPKAAMLTHINLINNGRYVGQAMRLTTDDVICCPPPLFHCFGLVMGFLASFTHGSTIIFPSAHFNAKQTLDAVVAEKATALLGVPTMFIAELEVMDTEPGKYQINTLRTGLAAGSPVPAPLMHQLREKMRVQGMLIAYGMTETSPVTFITSLDDPPEKMAKTLGRVLPHTSAKVIDKHGNIVPRGQRGEICTSGFALQTGYWKDEEKTKEAMRRDENGTLWMHTGDEGFIDEEGYGHITGRIKDLIIRGGENISPTEIEERLIAHPSISEACVVGLENERYGEVVGAFLRLAGNTTRKLTDDEVRAWVMEVLGRTKAPQYIFWIGDQEVGADLPKTGSGKYKKHLIRGIGNELVRKLKKTTRAKL